MPVFNKILKCNPNISQEFAMTVRMLQYLISGMSGVLFSLFVLIEGEYDLRK